MTDLLTSGAHVDTTPLIDREPRHTTLATVSVIVPVTERPEPLGALYEEYVVPLRESGRPFEFVFAVSPTSGAATDGLAELAEQGEPIRVMGAERNVGETALIRAALKMCRGDIIVTLPAYRRVKAAALVDLIATVENGADVATAATRSPIRRHASSMTCGRSSMHSAGRRSCTATRPAARSRWMRWL